MPITPGWPREKYLGGAAEPDTLAAVNGLKINWQPGTSALYTISENQGLGRIIVPKSHASICWRRLRHTRRLIRSVELAAIGLKMQCHTFEVSPHYICRVATFPGFQPSA